MALHRVPTISPFIRHLSAILALPFVATVALPALLLRGSNLQSPLLFRVTGSLLVVGGLVLVATTIHHFAALGRGTLAPWDPPRHLVVEGVYRYVRNPMISGVFFILAGESLIFSAAAIGLWASVFILLNTVYIPLVEEPALNRRFGAEYQTYCTHVPRWLPRLSAWHPAPAGQGRTPAA